MTSLPATGQRNQGFSLIEIMVGIAIGLISILIVMQVFSTFEGQKRTATGGADAQTNGGLSLYLIERDIRMSGYGFGNAAGCPLQRAYGGTVLPDLTLAPVSISDGLGGLPDSITLLSSNKSSWSVPARYTPPAPNGQNVTQFSTNAPVGLAQNDLVVIYENIANTATCSLLQVNNSNPVINPISHATGDWNTNTTIFPASGYSSDAKLMNLGSLMMHAYSLDANGNLVMSDYASATNTSSSTILAPGVVGFQAEYGFDTRPDPRTDVRVDTWSSALIDADGDGVAGASRDIQRIYAVRFAIVARNGLKEKPLMDGSCNITTSSPAWAGGAIDISRNPDGTTNLDWQCYRYKTFETVVPLRNPIWN